MTPTSSATAAPDPVTALSNHDGVAVRVAGEPRPLPAPNAASLLPGDAVTADETGRALLTFPHDSLIVEVLRRGDLAVGPYSFNGQDRALEVSEKAGSFFNGLNSEELINARLRIDSDYAIVTATGTEFLVVSETYVDDGYTPLNWVVALDAGPNDLTVRSRSQSDTRVLQSGQAVWVAPIGPPGAVFEADVTAVRAWLARQQEGELVEEIGEIIWDPANTLVDTADLPDPLPIDTPFTLDGIELRLDPRGDYARADCDGDGTADIWMRDGTILFRINPLQNRVRALDASVVNYAAPGSGALQAYNPAGYVAPRERAELTAGLGAAETLSVRSERQPYHYAALSLQEGCFLSMKLSVPPVTPTRPPTATPSPTALPPTPAPVATVPIPTPIRPTLVIPTVTQPPSATPSVTPTPCLPAPPPGWLPYTVQRGDTLYGLSRQTGASVAQIQQVNCTFNGLYVGDVLWLPPFPTPTHTPTPSLAVVLLAPENARVLECVLGSAPTGLVQSSGPTTPVTFRWRPQDAAASLAIYRLALDVTMPDGSRATETEDVAATEATLTLPCGATAVTWSVQAVASDGRLGPVAGPATFRFTVLEVPAPVVIAPLPGTRYTCEQGQEVIGVVFTWQRPDTVAAVDAYVVELRADDGTTETLTVAGDTTSTEAILACGVAMSWRVRATAGGQTGAWSEWQAFAVENAPERDVTPPAAPLAVQPEDGTQIDCSGPTAVTLTWRPGDAAADVAAYEVEVDFHGGETNRLTTSADRVTADQPVPCEQDVAAWRVRAIDSSGNVSEWSRTSTFAIAPADNQPPPPPNAIQPGTAYEQDPGVASCSGTVDLVWEAVSDAGGIRVYVVTVDAGGKDGWLPQTTLESEGTAVNFGPLQEDTNYRWRVYAVDGNGLSGEPSGWLYFQTPRCSQEPIG